MSEVELLIDPVESDAWIQRCENQKAEKKPRKRLKRLCAQIRVQMEFYFSDSNLFKDGFVKQLIDQREDRYVPISTFSNFNKIRELTSDMKLVVKALSTSEVLEVKEGGEYIRRKTPYKEPKDIDERTLYVESLPREADQDWLRQTFSQYGKVLYVSLPRYRTTGDIKGFAFIEYDTKDAMEKACHSPLDPNDDKNSRFPKFNKQLQTLQKQMTATGERVDEKKSRRRSNASDSSYCADDESTASKRQKRMSESSDAESTDAQAKKIQKTEECDKEKGRSRKRSADSGSENIDKQTSVDTTPVHKGKESETEHTTKKRKGLEDTTTGQEKAEEVKTSTMEPRGVMVDREKRKRLSEVTESDVAEAREVKRVRISEQVDVKENVEVSHKKRRNKKKKRKEYREKTEELMPPLKVIPKHVWLELRKEYLELQKSSMKSLKKSLKKIKKKQDKGGQGKVPLDSYIKGTEQTSEGAKDQQMEVDKRSTRVEYTPGVIIKIDTDQPCMRKELKETLSLVAEVPYVDFQDGDQQGHVRCATPEDALRVVASRPATFRVSLLQGEEESSYWMKINADRDQKRVAKTRSKKRGTQKLMDRAEKSVVASSSQKHIVFDD